MSVDLPLYQPDWPPARSYVLELEGEQSVHWALIGHIPHLEGVPNVLEAQKTLREELMGVLHTHKHIYDKHTDAYRHKTCQHEQKCTSTCIFYIRWALQWYGLQCHQKLYTWELIKFIVSDFMCVFSRSVSSPWILGCAGRCSPSAPSALPPSAPCPWMPSGTRDPQRSYGEREGGEGSVYVCVHGIIYVCVQMCICVHGCVFVCEWMCVCLYVIIC